MALGKLIKADAEAEAEEAKAAEAERIAEEQQQAVIKAAEEKASLNARLDSMEKAVERGYNNRQDTAPVQADARVAQQQLGITDEQLEQLIAEGKGAQAVQLISQQVSQNQLAAYNEKVGAVLGNVVKRGFKQEMAELKDHPFYEDLKDELKEYFDTHPNEMIEEGAVKEEFHRLVGANLTTLQTKAGERAAAEAAESEEESIYEKSHPTGNRRRAVEPPLRPASPTPTRPKEKAKLDPIRQELMDIYNSFGANMDEEEYMGIEEGKLLPKKMSVDIQLGKGKSNVSY